MNWLRNLIIKIIGPYVYQPYKPDKPPVEVPNQGAELDKAIRDGTL